MRVLAVLLLTGCTTMIRVQDAPKLKPIRVSDSMPIGLNPPVFAIEEGAVVGGHAANPSRVYHLVHVWGETFDVDRMEFNYPLRDELSSHGYRFAIGSRAAYQLNARVVGLTYNLFGNDSRVGWTEAGIVVEWTLSGPENFTLTTRGSSGMVRPHSLASLFNAFRASLRNFLADKRIAGALARTAVAPRPVQIVRTAPPPAPAPVVVRPDPVAPAPQPPPVVPAPAPPAPQPPPVVPAPAPPAPVITMKVIKRPPLPAAPAENGTIAERVRSGVVTVLAGDGWASGFVLDGSGLVLTSASAVAGAKTISIVRFDGVERPGRVESVDRAADLALLRVDGGGFAALRMRLDTAAPGEEVVAIGTPFHPALSFSISRGRVTGARANRLVTDVRVSAGNGGGPLVDSRGRVVGIVSWDKGNVPSSRASVLVASEVFRLLGLAYANQAQ